ncbi:MAG: prepilin-type N-terminal cleavage/methylation domain-containing protein [Gemmataceae bacterium]|nr:prepilin-type N-terminal cleavage/methylation domain-containing protein [Gemmataceae bacterium]
MSRRQGATLVEVLVAIFIMGIGLMALLTLFPLGAFRMADAIQKERAAQAGTNAGSIAAAGQVRTDRVVANRMLGRDAVGNQILPVLPNWPEGPSYPVYVDPLGVLTTGGAAALGGTHVAGAMLLPTNTPVLPRVAPGFLTTRLDALRWFTLPDDISFESDPTVTAPRFLGHPKYVIAGTIERDYRYSWAYLVQRPRAADANVVNLAVVVYAGRGMSLTGNLTLPEYSYDGFAGGVSEVVYGLGLNTVRIRYEYFGHYLPQVRAGSWILDLSVVRNDIHANFHRVTGVTEGVEMIGGKGYAYVDLEVQQPFRGFPVPSAVLPAADPFTGPTPAFPNDRARVVILENVVEVFERGLGRGQ